MKSEIKIHLLFLAICLLVLSGCAGSVNKAEINCSTWDCLEKNKNKDAFVTGTFQKYTPWTQGKGADYPFWNWEILLSDGNAVPVNDEDSSIDFSSFDGKKVNVECKIFFGIIIGCEEGQNATGFRIDPYTISENN